ncbi:MAG: hypothetical protein CEO19_463 [Parcubacteria group bacterium Gr01-1014_73]|nr:MAG: hypothetical protein CEO19_463 [Parcubacteria group bacterium Gr01-1014_73]
MVETEKKGQKINPIGLGKPDISIVDAALVSLSNEVKEVKKELETQRSETKNIIIGVLVAFVLVVVTVAVEVLLSHKNNNDIEKSLNLNEQLTSQKIELNNLSNKVDNLKVRNPYLK